MTRAGTLLVLLVLVVLAVIAFRMNFRTPQPEAAIDSGAEPAEQEPHPIEEVRSEDFDGGNRYLVRNLLAGPIEVECSLQKVRNVEGDPRLPRRMVLPALASTDPADQDRSNKELGRIDSL